VPQAGSARTAEPAPTTSAQEPGAASREAAAEPEPTEEPGGVLDAEAAIASKAEAATAADGEPEAEPKQAVRPAAPTIAEAGPERGARSGPSAGVAVPGPLVRGYLVAPSKAADPPEPARFAAGAPAAKDGGAWPWEPPDPWQPARQPGGRAAPAAERPVGLADGASATTVLPAPVPAAAAAGPGVALVDGGGQAVVPAAAAAPAGWVAQPPGLRQATQVMERVPARPPPAGVPAETAARRTARLLGVPRSLLAAALVPVLLLGLFGVDTALASGTVRRGVSVGGVGLGGLGRAAARTRLAAAAAQVEARPLVLRAETARVELPRSQAGVRLDLDGSVAAAFAVGRSGPFDLGRLRSWFGGIELPWRVRLESQGVERAVARLEGQIRRPIREPALRLTGTKVELLQGTPGRGVDPVGARRALEAAAGLPAGAEVALPISEQRPTVDQAAAQAAADQASKLLSAPLTVTVAGHSATLQPAELAPRVRSQVRDGRLVVELVPEALDGLLRRRAPFAYSEPRDARFEPAGGHIRLLPAVAGRVADPAKAAAALLAAGGKDGAGRTAALPVNTSQPKFSTAAAKALGVKQVISSFTTTFSSSDAPRVHNISLIAAAVNGQLVLPGQVFSMNAATGERTPDKGYRTAKVIKDGEIVPGLGGGVCQAGTTMFNAVFFAGLPVVERRNHSLHISHYPMGRDATLNWPGTDLKFRNDSPYGIFITARATPATMNVTLWSTSRGYQVDFSTSNPYNFRSPPTRFEDDPTLPAGQQVVESSGSAGFDVTVQRTVTHNGQVVRKDTFVSNYVPWSKVVRRGTMPPGPPQPGPPPGPGA
jgi:vancomycin resistance protein YoaR